MSFYKIHFMKTTSDAQYDAVVKNLDDILFLKLEHVTYTELYKTL